jgi:hypothetical protein
VEDWGLRIGDYSLRTEIQKVEKADNKKISQNSEKDIN